MKILSTLVLTVSIMLSGVWANADTMSKQMTDHSHEDCPPGIGVDYLAWKEPSDGKWDAFSEDGSEIQVTKIRTEPVLYSADNFGVMVSPADVSGEEEVDAWTLMLAGKLSRPGNVSPFITLGAGIMPTSMNTQVGAMETSVEASRSLSTPDSDTKACGKLGAGVDFFPTENVSIGLEGSYVFGLGDLEFDSGFLGDREMNTLYLMFTLGAAYHF